jgi:orotate phosphoribosyltransferase
MSILRTGSIIYYWVDMRDICNKTRSRKSIKDALADLEDATDPFERAVNTEYYAIAKAVICCVGATCFPDIKRTFPLHQAYKIIGKVTG